MSYNWQNTTDADRRELADKLATIARIQIGDKVNYRWQSRELAEYMAQYGWTVDGIRTFIRRWSAIYAQDRTPLDVKPLPRSTYTGDGDYGGGVSVYDGALNLTGDFMVIGDVHLPTTDWGLVEEMLAVANKQLARPRNLIIAGDLINADADSRYEHIAPFPSRRLEIDETQKFFNYISPSFDHIYYFLGNHEHRLIKKLEGDIGAEQYKWLLCGKHGDKVTVSLYSYATLCSGGIKWIVTHQRNYSKRKLKVANELAQKYQCNVVTLHQHHVGVSRDDYERYTIIDGGGLHESKEMAYVQLVPNTHSRMNKGFVMVKNGTGHLITPYKSMTDMSMWR